MSGRLRVGVIGTGVIGQVMHLHFLRELADRFETVAVCDLSAASAAAAARDYGVAIVHTDWREMVAERPRRGPHPHLGQPRADRDRRGRARRPPRLHREAHVLLDATRRRAMVDAADAAGVALMVGYPKRYDPAFARFTRRGRRAGRPRLLRVTTTESPFVPYVAPLPAEPAGDRRRRRGAGRRCAPTRDRRLRRGDRHRRRVAGGPVPRRCCSTPWCTRSTRCAACWASPSASTTSTCGPASLTVVLDFGDDDRGDPLAGRARDDPLLDGVHRCSAPTGARR